MTTTTKRAYKLQEFVAHSLSVNCLKIGKKSSRVLVTGGEDHKVNLWAIGKPNAILSLSGHTSGIDSVSFDTTEVLVAAGAASGTVKLWDLEEAKIIRTLTGHRSNCISLDFHPFGEFFASGSLDTNLKIWDIRRKGCIHTYKGHTRGVNAIRFSPDGRWVVSGGEDNSVKLWDLTAGKLLHDLKSHEGQIQCIDFHPQEYLLATGSADKTVKFWDLETFELMGSAGPESTGVRSMTFNTDGKTLLCGLHENLKVYSWEPIKNHATVDVGWSKLSDMNVHEGKLLGCSFNQSCVGVWVVDISRIEPYAKGSTAGLNIHLEPKTHSGGSTILKEDHVKDGLGRLSVSYNASSVKETKSITKFSVQQNSEVSKDSKSLSSTASAPCTPQRTSLNAVSRPTQINSSEVVNAPATKRQTAKVQSIANIPMLNKSDVIPVLVPRNNPRVEQGTESRKEGGSVKTLPLPVQSKTPDLRKFSNVRDNLEMLHSSQPDNELPKAMDFSVPDRNIITGVKSSITVVAAAERKGKDDKHINSGIFGTNANTDAQSTYQHESYDFRGADSDVIVDRPHLDSQKGGRTNSLVSNSEQMDRSSRYRGLASSNASRRLRGYPLPGGDESVSASDEDTIADLMEPHNQFVGSMQSRLAKLQVVHSYWQRHDIKGVLSAISKMSDHSVLADVMSLLAEKIDMVTLDICVCLLPLLTGLLESNMDRHQEISLGMLLKLVRVFGSVIYASLSAQSPVGVDIEAEQRLERCNLCFVELEKVKLCLPALTRYGFHVSHEGYANTLAILRAFNSICQFCRRGGSMAKSAHELNLALQEVS
ncbi:katanin p80 WD40 repeat-containing subunit B1 homolog KTN80.4-like isoform X1 [Primulina huaijiensis]|uniref:katanin p80 WD40 repeat-containing subunit B1 homolog KTN80.4-like isoform X1 n=1 Tax=Primulina huaijiensis TaxID=1492673 RepID=UPI003CC794D2